MLFHVFPYVVYILDIRGTLFNTHRITDSLLNISKSLGMPNPEAWIQGNLPAHELKGLLPFKKKKGHVAVFVDGVVLGWKLMVSLLCLLCFFSEEKKTTTVSQLELEMSRSCFFDLPKAAEKTKKTIKLHRSESSKGDMTIGRNHQYGYSMSQKPPLFEDPQNGSQKNKTHHLLKLKWSYRYIFGVLTRLLSRTDGMRHRQHLLGNDLSKRSFPI